MRPSDLQVKNHWLSSGICGKELNEDNEPFLFASVLLTSSQSPRQCATRRQKRSVLLLSSRFNILGHDFMHNTILSVPLTLETVQMKPNGPVGFYSVVPKNRRCNPLTVCLLGLLLLGLCIVCDFGYCNTVIWCKCCLFLKPSFILL